MTIEIFDNDDTSYQRWMERNGRGYVLSVSRSPKSGKASLHRAGCNHITAYGPYQLPGSFTGSKTIKVCSLDRSELERWVNDNRPTNKEIKGCRTCETTLKI